MNHWHEPEALSPENSQPFPLQLPPQSPEHQRELHAAAVRRQIHAETMRDNPQGPFQLLGPGLFGSLTKGHVASAMIGILAGAAIGFYVGNVIMKPAGKKAKANGRKRRAKAKANFRGKVTDYADDDDLDPSTWDDSDEGDEDEDEDEGSRKSK